MYSAHPLRIKQIRDDFRILARASDSNQDFNGRNGRRIYFTKIGEPSSVDEQHGCRTGVQAFVIQAINFKPVRDVKKKGPREFPQFL